LRFPLKETIDFFSGLRLLALAGERRKKIAEVFQEKKKAKTELINRFSAELMTP
jgi:hypothetical protein